MWKMLMLRDILKVQKDSLKVFCYLSLIFMLLPLSYSRLFSEIASYKYSQHSPYFLTKCDIDHLMIVTDGWSKIQRKFCHLCIIVWSRHFTAAKTWKSTQLISKVININIHIIYPWLCSKLRLFWPLILSLSQWQRDGVTLWNLRVNFST